MKKESLREMWICAMAVNVKNRIARDNTGTGLMADGTEKFGTEKFKHIAGRG